MAAVLLRLEMCVCIRCFVEMTLSIFSRDIISRALLHTQDSALPSTTKRD